MTISSINLDKRHIILIGFRGVGKSTIARLLGKNLGYAFYDTDEDITNITNLSITDIFRIYGESYFRKLEEYVVEMRCLSLLPIIISTGGGVVISEKSREIIKKSGTVILLTASQDTIVNRIEKDNNRPSLTGKSLKDEVASILSIRTPYYLSIKDLEIDTSIISPHEVVEDIIHFI